VASSNEAGLAFCRTHRIATKVGQTRLLDTRRDRAGHNALGGMQFGHGGCPRATCMAIVTDPPPANRKHLPQPNWGSDPAIE